MTRTPREALKAHAIESPQSVIISIMDGKGGFYVDIVGESNPAELLYMLHLLTRQVMDIVDSLNKQAQRHG